MTRVDDLDAKRAYVAERLAQDPLPAGPVSTRAVGAEIARLGLEAHVVDLELRGFAVLPPDVLGADDLIVRLQAAVDRVDAERQATGGPQFGLGTPLYHLLREDRAFEEVVLWPAPLALITYLLGYRAKLSQLTALVKGRGTPPLPFHADAAGKYPAPWPTYAQVANATWLLSDYSKEEGALCLLPGSHRLGRPPGEHEHQLHDSDLVHTIEAPAGSVVVWHGNTWHGAHPRTVDGQRRTLVAYYVRTYLQAQEPYNVTTTPEMLQRNPARFGAIVGLGDPSPWDQYGPRRFTESPRFFHD